MSATGFSTISDIKRANVAAGHHFFDASSLRFFRSEILPTVYGGRYFVTSEQFVGSDGSAETRRYTVRSVSEDGTAIDTVGEFQQYATVGQARAAAKAVALFGRVLP